MDIVVEIMAEHSRAQADNIAAWIGADAERFKPLMQLWLTCENRIAPRVTLAIGAVTENNRALILPHLPAMVKRLEQKGIHDAIKRGIVRELQFVAIPEDLQGDVMNICFEFVTDPREAVAIRAFSMTVLANLAKAYPDIKYEITSILEDALEQDVTPGFKNRAQKTLKALTKL